MKGPKRKKNLGVPHNICCVQQGLARKPPRHARLVAVSGPSCQAIFSGAVGVLPARGRTLREALISASAVWVAVGFGSRCQRLGLV